MRFEHVGPLVFAALLCCGCGSRTTSTASELEQLKGAWQVVAIEAAGNPVPAERVRQISLQYVFDGDRITIRRPNHPDNNGTVSIDAAASPKKMTINVNPAVRAIYAVEGGKLRVCLMVDENPNAGYPTVLASLASPKTDLLTLERSSAAAQTPVAQAPGAPAPAPMAPPPAASVLYVYSQRTGKLTLNDQLVAVGYSGKGAAKNDPAQQAAKDGPIPTGEYMLTGFRDEPKLGGKIMGLLPVAGTNYFNRFPSETFAIIAETDNLPSGCFIVVGRDVLEKLSTAPLSKVQVVK
jgi:uncharacterized protein (TIGR03067 family)